MALVQTCDVDKKEASCFLSTIDDQTITKSLYNANGNCGNIGVSATRNLVTKCDFSTSEYLIPAPTTFKAAVSRREVVVDIDAFCFNSKDCYGIAVATNRPASNSEVDEEEADRSDDGFITKKDKAAREAARASTRALNHVSLFYADRSEFILRRRIKVNRTITCMKVLISPSEMPVQRAYLSAKIGLWPNVIAIGCEKSSCYIGQFSDFDPTNQEHLNTDIIMETTSTTDALKALVHENRFTYNNGYFNKDDEKVTAVAYIPCYGVTVIGLSNGCVVLVPLDGKSSISCLTIPYSTPVNFLIVLEPEYDPQGGFYIFSARERPPDVKNSALVIFSHKIARQADGSGGYEYQDMNSVMLPMKDGDYWINVHGIVKKRKRRDGDVSNNATADDSHLPAGLNTTQQKENDGMERTLLFYSYITLKGEMKGGLFDLNAFYTLRCGTQQVRFDEYGQHPICSQFTMVIPRKSTQEPLFRAKDISWVHCEGVDQFDSPFFDRDPVFQPMSYTLDVRVYTYGKFAYDAVVHNLQNTVLDHISRSLSACLTQPDVALALLERTGLVLAPATKRERMRNEERPANERVQKELDKIMRAVISDELCRTRVIEFIESSTDRKIQLNIGRMIFNVLREIVERMDDAIMPLFESVPFAMLSKDAKEIINYCPAFFKFAEEVLWKVRERGAKLGNDTHPLRHTRELHALMAFDLRVFIASATWIARVLPTSEEWTHELLAEVEELNEERNERARREGHPLFLHAVLSRLHGATQDDYLWVEMADPVQWYPPRLYNLLWLLRQQEAEREDRMALIFYYLMDVEEVMRRNRKRPAEERRAYVLKDGDSIIKSYLACVADNLMRRTGCNGVAERWESDMKGVPVNKKDNDQLAPPRKGKLTEDEKTELIKLMRQPFKRLQRPDEDRIKALMMKQDFGIFKYNLFLIKMARYREVADLPDPGKPYTHQAVADYFKYKQLALYQKSQLPPYVETHISFCPYVITRGTSTVDTTMNESRVVRAATIHVQGKTPKKLTVFKRLAPAAAAGAADGTAASIQTTPTGPQSDDVARINALMKTPSMRFHNQRCAIDEDEEGEESGRKRENDSDIVPDEIARVRETMRTPRSRANLAARTAAAAGGETPEGAPRVAVTVPTSILKSAHKDSRIPQSATKSRLRFAQVFDEKSISPRERNNSVSTIDSMSQPNFDDSFDDGAEQVHSKSIGSHSTTDGLSTTSRLEKEIEEAEKREGVMEEEEETDESVRPLSTGDEEEMMEERMEEEEEVSEEGAAEASAAAAAAAGGTFTIYHDSDAASTPGSADVAFFAHSAASSAAAAAGDQFSAAAITPTKPSEEKEKLPEGVNDEEEEEAAAPAAAVDEHANGDEKAEESVEDGEKEEEQPPADDVIDEEQKEEEEEKADEVNDEEEKEDVSFVIGEGSPIRSPPQRKVTPAQTVYSDPVDGTFRPLNPQLSDTFRIYDSDDERPAEVSMGEGDVRWALLHARVAGGGAFEATAAAAVAAGAGEAAASAAGGSGEETETAAAAGVLSSTFTVEVAVDVRGGGEEQKEEEGGEESAADAAAAVKEAVEAADAAIEEEQKEEEREQPAAEEEEKDEEEQEKEEEPTKTPPPTPDEKEGEEVDVAPAAAEVAQPPPTKTPPPTPVEEEDEEVAAPAAEEEAEGEKEEEQPGEEEEAAVVPAAPAAGPLAPIEEETEEAVAAAAAAALERQQQSAARAARKRTPPRPKPRTIFPNRDEPIALGLRSYSYMEDGIEKSYEEQESSDEEKEEGEKKEEEDILARLAPRRSSSRLQQHRGEESAAAAAPPAILPRKRTTSRSRKESEQLEMAGPSSSSAAPLSPREKRKKKDEDEEEEMKKEEDGHVYTTTRTRTIEERYVEGGDGVMRHTVKQSTKVIETTDGVIVSTEQEDRDTVSVEGDKREEMLDDADRVTPPMVEAAVEPTTGRKSSRAARTPATATRSSARTKKDEKKDEEKEKEDEEEKKKLKMREEKATTPVRTPSHSVARRKLMGDEVDVKPQEPVTPRRSTRKLSESSSTVSQTPSKSTRKSSRTAQTPSREQSVVPVSPTRRAAVDEEKKKAEPPNKKRGRPALVLSVSPVPDEEEEPQMPVVKRRTTIGAARAAAAARSRSASESVAQPKEEEEGEKEEEVDNITALRKKAAESRAMRAQRAEEKEKALKRKTGRAATLKAIPEDTVAKANRRVEEEEDQPGTSQQTARSAARRKRSISESAVKETKEIEMKTPSKKKARGSEKDEEEEEGAGDQSMLRRSTRKAAVTANEGLKTPSKSVRAKQ